MNEIVETYFENLTDEEKAFVHEVPVLAAILVAGADNDIKKIELRVASQITKIKAHTSTELKAFYAEVSEDFHNKFEHLLARYPNNAAERNPAIREDLKVLQPILIKMKRTRADEFVTSVHEIARYTAEATGGVLGYYSVSEVEKKALFNLDLILNG